MNKKTNIIFFLLSFICLNLAGQEDYKNIPFWNFQLSFEERAADVVSRLTLEEKVMQLIYTAPAINRLGIPAYNWWNEILHGVARTPFRTTVFPQAIAMAATWDTASIGKMAYYSALEGRAINNIVTKQNNGGSEQYCGLTYWTPNINIFRDPRWGRGMETYGEDPFLTSQIGMAFVTGLQGNHPKYLLAAACAKHFAVHSGPERSRHSDNFNPSSYDLWETYLPAFQYLVVNAKVAGVMCAYNAVNTQPCCANDLLMNDILRNKWKFTGYVTSDCWALNDFYAFHKTHKDATMAAVDGLTHSTDVECGNSVYPTLLDAVKKGLLNENEIDVSLRRLFVIRLRLGQFDPPNIMPYSNTSDTLLECEAHKALALKIAQQSIVLLKNENNVLPLKKDIKKIAVIGPNADNPLTQLANYNGFPSEIVTVLEGIKEKLGSNVEIIYDKAINYTDDSLLIYSENDIFFYQSDKKVKADFFNNTILEGKPVLTTFKNRIDDFWVEGQQPENGIKGTYFSVRYTTYYKSPSTETTTFIAEGDNGYKIFLNDNLVCDAWDNGKKEPQSFQTEMKKDTIYKIVIEYYQGDGFGRMKFGKGIKIKTDFNALKNKLKDVDVIVFVGGISAELEGEEMPVKYPGFDGGDRTKIELPEVQTKLMRSLKETGKPVVFVMMTGSAISCNWENENIPAILNVWYGGQSAGTAVADVLFGDYNPAGRLPVTFYKSTSDLPDFKDYSMLNRTYRYFNGPVLYPFGYGLSYTQFEYTNLKLSNYEITKNGTVTITVNVKNTGNYDGDEVVQLYLKNKTSIQTQPIKSLRAFKRIGIKKGENITLDFVLSADDFKYFNEQLNDFVIDPGIYEIQIGASSADIRLHTDIQIKP